MRTCSKEQFLSYNADNTSQSICLIKLLSARVYFVAARLLVLEFRGNQLKRENERKKIDSENGRI